MRQVILPRTALIQRIADSGVSCNLNLIGVPDELFGTLSKDELSNMVAAREYARFSLASCTEGSIKLSVEEGKA